MIYVNLRCIFGCITKLIHPETARKDISSYQDKLFCPSKQLIFKSKTTYFLSRKSEGGANNFTLGMDWDRRNTCTSPIYTYYIYARANRLIIHRKKTLSASDATSCVFHGAIYAKRRDNGPAEKRWGYSRFSGFSVGNNQFLPRGARNMRRRCGRRAWKRGRMNK